MLIQLKKITKKYDSDGVEFIALKGISFTIDKGEMVGIIGPSGSGKSTTMHILGALDTPTTGTYILNGQNIEELSDKQLAKIRSREIGFVFQSFNLLPRTSVISNVMLPLVYQNVPYAERKERAIKALQRVGLEDKKDSKSNQLSGGQIQRVAIARAIVTEPSVILADEPTGNLDTKTSEKIMKIFQEMHAEGRTIIVITHEPDIAEACTRIITLRDGLILSDKLNSKRKMLI